MQAPTALLELKSKLLFKKKPEQNRPCHLERTVDSTSSHEFKLVAQKLRLRHPLIMETVVFHPPI